MATKLTINELVDDVLSELERLNYSYNSLCGFRSFYKRVLDFANERKELFFSEQLGREFLKEKYNCTINYYQESMTNKFKAPI
ncbi:integrase family protein [Candidatus Magnetomorum sp. HK-1]|nr:integrase family protein [Candidatus Magnetomorum sp. HK-1]